MEADQREHLSSGDGVEGGHGPVPQVHAEDLVGAIGSRRGRLVWRRGLRLNSVSRAPRRTAAHQREHIWAVVVGLAGAWRLRLWVRAYPSRSTRVTWIGHIDRWKIEAFLKLTACRDQHRGEVDPGREPGQLIRPHRRAGTFPPDPLLAAGSSPRVPAQGAIMPVRPDRLTRL